MKLPLGVAGICITGEIEMNHKYLAHWRGHMRQRRAVPSWKARELEPACGHIPSSTNLSPGGYPKPQLCSWATSQLLPANQGAKEHHCLKLLSVGLIYNAGTKTRGRGRVYGSLEHTERELTVKEKKM